jgi:steroid delta-isomerase-like uncharacterized protein
MLYLHTVGISTTVRMRHQWRTAATRLNNVAYLGTGAARELRELWRSKEAHSLLDRYLDAWNRHDLNAVIAMHTDDTVFAPHTGAVTHSGREAVLEAFRADLALWPDVSWKPARRVVAANACVLESTMRATAATPLGALGFTVDAGSRVAGRCVDILVIEDGRIARKDTYFDVVEILGSGQAGA